MGEIVNLRRVKKQRRHDKEVREAAENRARFGQSQARLAAGKAEAERDRAALDGARIEPAKPS